ncbi:MAG TPA: hypothetical protein PLH03_01190 [Methylophilaceae bacterium]|nr:hypothetical protein [Methylophilaceae bacterium]
MKTHTKYTPLALAVAALFASPFALAEGNEGPRGGHDKDGVSIKIKKEVEIERDVRVHGDPRVVGRINVEASSAALTNQEQTNVHNSVTNNIVDNDAAASGGVLSNASGNIGLNITAGDNNYQDNSAALSAVDAEFVFADAESFSSQSAYGNTTSNLATANRASLSGNVLANASGNIGVNVSAGGGNLPASSLAAWVSSSGTMAEADVSSSQKGAGNVTNNQGATYTVTHTTDVKLSGSLTGGSFGFGVGGYAGSAGGTYAGREGGVYGGTTSGTYAGNASGTTKGTSDQIGNVYLDQWQGQTHPGSSNIGHVDVDNQAQGAVDLNKDGGAFAFNNAGTYGGTESGTTKGTESGAYSGGEAGVYGGKEGGVLGFVEASAIGLSGTFSGVVTNVETLFRPHVNNASVSGNVLAHASGNIGVNVAAGTNNLQANHLAIAAALGNGGGGTGGGE